MNTQNSYKNILNIKLFLLIFFIFQQIISIRIFFSSKYIVFDPLISWIFYVFLSSLIFWYFLNTKNLLNIFTNKIFFSLIVFSLLIIFFKLYPIADNMKYLNMGIDQDDCFLVFIDNFKQKQFLYSLTYLGNPCSTGLLEFIIYFPVIFWKNYFSLIPIISISIFYFILSKELSSKIAVLFCLTQFCNLIYLEMGIAGSDFIMIGVAYIASLRLASLGFRNKNFLYLISSFVLFCFFYGSRSIFLLILPFNIYLFWLSFGNKIFKLFIPVIILTALSYLIPFFVNSEMYTPFHLFGKLYSLMFPFKYILAFGFVLILLIEIKYKILMKNLIQKNNNLFFHVLILTIPLLLAIFSSLLQTNDFAGWEELNYSLIFLPSIFYFTAIKYKKELQLIF